MQSIAEFIIFTSKIEHDLKNKPIFHHPKSILHMEISPKVVICIFPFGILKLRERERVELISSIVNKAIKSHSRSHR